MTAPELPPPELPASGSPTHPVRVPPETVLTEPTRPVSAHWVALISIASLGVWMALLATLQIVLPNQIEGIDAPGKVGDLGWITAAGAVVALAANPLAGALSDRTTGRFGRRRPWILGGAVCAAAGLVILAGQHTLLGVAAGWCVVQAGVNAALAGITTSVPDHVPVRQRAVVSAWVGIPQALGLVVGGAVVTLLATGIVSGYLAVAVVVIALTVPFVWQSTDARLDAAHRPPFDLRTFATSFWVSPRCHPDFAWAWITRFLVMLGNAFGTLYLLYFLKDAVHYEQLYPGKTAQDGLFVLVLIYTASAVVAAAIGGKLSDRFGRRKIIVSVASTIGACAALVLAVEQTWPAAMVSSVLFGVSFGAYVAVDQALITQVLPTAAARGKDLGVINIANSAPQVLGPAIAAPVIADLGGYPTLYALTAAVALAGAVLVWKIRGVR